MRYRFVFDPNRCVGCQACVVACGMENGKDQSLAWRTVNTFNAFRHPLLRTQHLSLACNHCEDAICLRSCPARAYTRDAQTGAIIHHAEHCMGCQYCTWACPYDGPRFVPQKGIIEKCTFCNARLLEGRKPACVERCPMGALELEPIPVGEVMNPESRRMAGFPDQKLKPSIRFKPLRRDAPPDLKVESALLAPFLEQVLQAPPTRIHLRQEWPLLLFTQILTFLVADRAVYSLNGKGLSLWLFLLLGALALLLSVAHLGQKGKAYRAIFNVAKSPLSQEIFFTGLFMASVVFSAVWSRLMPEGLNGVAFHGLTVLLGLLALYSMDRIYLVLRPVKPWNLHSAQTLFGAIYLFSILNDVWPLFWVFGGLRLLLYLYRKIGMWRELSWESFALGLFRVGLGFGLPALVFAGPLRAWAGFGWPYWVLGVLVGEFIDRVEFYRDLACESPKRVVWDQLHRIFKPR